MADAPETEEENERVAGTEGTAGTASAPDTEAEPPSNLGEGTQDEEEQEQKDDYTPLGSSDDQEKQRNYNEYKRLVVEIKCQNEIIERVKMQIQDTACKPCITACEQKELRCLQECLEQEMHKLRCLINKAMHLQNFGSKRHYREIALVTTFDEDQMAPISYYCDTMQVKTSRKSFAKQLHPARHWKSVVSSDISEEEKPCSCQDRPESHDTSSTPDEDERKLMREVLEAIRLCKKKNHVCKDQTSKTVSPNQKKKICQTESSFEKLKNKIFGMQETVEELKEEICRREVERKLSGPCPLHKQKRDVPPQPCSTGHIPSRATRPVAFPTPFSAPCSMPCPNPCPNTCTNDCQFSSHGPCHDDCHMVCEKTTLPPQEPCASRKTRKEDLFQKLKDNYVYLLTEYTKKDGQLKELNKKLRSECASLGTGRIGIGDGSNADESELVLLRTRVNEYKEEQIEFKCLMKEQAAQLEDYRNKYISAQQKVEEQNALIEKLNMNNKRVEKQINMELKAIRAKFQEKLNELLQYPKLLENEQLKLSDVCKQKEAMENKLMIVCKELKVVKARLDNAAEDCRPQLQKCQVDLENVTRNYEDMQRQRDLFCEQLKVTREDLDTLRSESAKIIARTKERFEVIKEQMQERMDRLEKDLAQCRATACLSVNDREVVIREMQGQLNTLSYSFDAAQKQIKTLRNHIAYMSNENCFPIKC
ncbi:uncharacterized protein LOC119633591 [Glossina fuscipes]|uniref:Uncharacterized protein LOC119633591 n=1 Tax=Glossina fuscipes TaxID=7396 RepID=A0A8U0WCM0_9MUSC|nr:uncharacterized protein LOC119633591 [Glossina fuscipes]